MVYYDQHAFDIRCEWGEAGVRHLAPISDVVIIVDVLSFSTSVDIATNNGALVYPYRGDAHGAATYAARLNAVVARKRRYSADAFSLAPSSLVNIPADTRLVLPSPNGSTLSLQTGTVPTFAGCLRNASAVARAAAARGSRISMIPAGERWRPDLTLRPALEDWIGAGAIVHALAGHKSPEALAAETAFLRFREDVLSWLQQTGSGYELIAQGFEEDLMLAADLDSSHSAPLLIDGAYRNAHSTG
jgi:2-phosphosulfolactate phosphatase